MYGEPTSVTPTGHRTGGLVHTIGRQLGWLVLVALIVVLIRDSLELRREGLLPAGPAPSTVPTVIP